METTAVVEGATEGGGVVVVGDAVVDDAVVGDAVVEGSGAVVAWPALCPPDGAAVSLPHAPSSMAQQATRTSALERPLTAGPADTDHSRYLPAAPPVTSGSTASPG
ncbi:MAG: hypothetical protein M3203_09790 [Actinomycetota bacterium]|nr:hypothetical protein [Actinomycetota bacterium]